MDGIDNVAVGGTSSFDQYLKLAPPGKEGDPFGNLATNIKGKVIGESDEHMETLIRHLGFSEKDTMGSALDELESSLTQMFGLVINYLNSIDPTSPAPAPFKTMILAADNKAKAGELGSVELKAADAVNINGPATPTGSTTSDDDGEVVDADGSVGGDGSVKNADGTPRPDLGAKLRYDSPEQDPGYSFGNLQDSVSGHMQVVRDISKDIGDDIDAARAENLIDNMSTFSARLASVGGNPWLAGSLFLDYLESFSELQRILQKNKVVQGMIELASMNMIVELAKSTADAIMAIAKTNQMLHLAAAGMAAVSIAISVVSIGGAMKAAAGKVSPPTKPTAENPTPPPPPPPKWCGLTSEQFTMGGQMAPQMEKMGTAASQAATDTSQALLEGAKEMLRTQLTIREKTLAKASELFKQMTDDYKEILQAKDKAISDIGQANANSLRR